jgi:hypothetical protein
VTTYVRLGGYGVTWHFISDRVRQTPGHEPQRLTACGRAVRSGDETWQWDGYKAPVQPVCLVCLQVGGKP